MVFRHSMDSAVTYSCMLFSLNSYIASKSCYCGLKMYDRVGPSKAKSAFCAVELGLYVACGADLKAAAGG